MSDINHEPAVPATPGTPPAAPARRAWVLPVVTGVVGLALGVLVGAIASAVVTTAEQEATAEAAAEAAEEAKNDKFTDAARRCGLSGSVEIADEGRTMIVDGEGEESFSGDVTFSGLDCIIDAVGTPASISELMYSTRSLDGRQTGEWDDVSASWGYHPDDGLDIIFVIED